MKDLSLAQPIEELPSIFKTFTSKAQVEGVIYSNICEWFQTIDKDGEYIVILNPVQSCKVKITVKESAQQDSPFFHFNEIYNNGKGIPLLTMVGCKIDERENMVKMDLWDEQHTIHWIGWILKSKIIQEVPA